MHKKNTITFPTLLTILRLVLSPLFLPILLVYLLPFNILWINSALAAIFILFALTDFFDGYLARKYKQETKLGRILDPIADKFLVYSMLIALLAAHKIYFYWVLILIGREIFMMGLRQIALEQGMSVHVSWIAKLKTMFQMMLLTWIILNPSQSLGLCAAPLWNGIEYGLLVSTLFLSVFSAWLYYKNFMHALKMQGDDHD